MTVEEEIQELLKSKGMLDTHAKAVIAAAKESEVLKDSGLHWGDDIEGYPDFLMATIKMSVMDTAKDWIKENCPKAFYRPLFEDA